MLGPVVTVWPGAAVTDGRSWGVGQGLVGQAWRCLGSLAELGVLVAARIVGPGMAGLAQHGSAGSGVVRSTMQRPARQAWRGYGGLEGRGRAGMAQARWGPATCGGAGKATFSLAWAASIARHVQAGGVRAVRQRFVGAGRGAARPGQAGWARWGRRYVLGCGLARRAGHGEGRIVGQGSVWRGGWGTVRSAGEAR